MKVLNADGGTEFDSDSFGGVVINKHKKADGSYITGTGISLNSNASITAPDIINYSDYPNRNIKVIPLTSGDTYYKVLQPNISYSGFSTVNYARIAYFSTSDFTPSLATHGFVRRDTPITVLLT